jgi:Ca-activated chloride channel family protein
MKVIALRLVKRELERALVLLSCILLACAQSEAQDQSKAATPVKLSVLVLDKQNLPVAGLRQQDFVLLENGKPQTVSFFSAEDIPLSYGLVIDTSGSLRSQQDKLRGAALQIINGSKPSDEGFMTGFIDRTMLAQDFTREKSVLAEGLNRLSIHPGQTALVDAIYASAVHLNERKAENTRRALILITDGEERNSYYKVDQLIDYLRANDVQIFIIGLVRELEDNNGGLIKKSSRDEAEKLLERLARETGGRVFYPKDVKDVQKAAEEIMLDLHSQYVIGYVPSIQPNVKPYRKVEVTVAEASGKSKRKIIARAGYTLTQRP